MKKVLLTLCGAVLLMVLLTAPALAGVFYRTDMKCTGGPFTTGFATIQEPSRDLTISLFGVTSGISFEAQITCFGPPGASSLVTPVGPSAGAPGKLVVRVKGLATAASLGLVPGQDCLDIRIDVNEFGGGYVCTEGFTP